MSSCVASCCTCFPKASFAFATLASSPTADAPLSCRFAFKYSTQPNHRTPGQKLPLPRNRARCGSVPNVAAPWWLSRDLPLPNSNSVLHLFSQESPHENYNFKLPYSVRLTTYRRGVFFVSSHDLPFPASTQSLASSQANSNQTNAASALVNSRTRSQIP